MADLRKFSGRIRVIGQRVADNADALTRKVALAVDSAVVLATPVDTGRARANWQVELDNAASGVREPFVPGEAGSTGGPNAQQALDEGRDVIAQYKSGQTIHITNNLPYIGRLNDGHSAQAPSGFVESAVLAGVTMVQGASSILSNAIKDEL